MFSVLVLIVLLGVSPFTCFSDVKIRTERILGVTAGDFVLVAGFLVFFIVTVGMCVHRLWYDTYIRRRRHLRGAHPQSDPLALAQQLRHSQ